MNRRLLFLIIPLLLVILVACQSPLPIETDTVIQTTGLSNISQIYVNWLSIGFIDTEYKIDLVNKRIYQFSAGYGETPLERDKNAENEGYQQFESLSQDKVDAFLKDASICGLADWNESYILEDSYDGYQWGITVTFSDGIIKKIYGRNAFPETWSQMAEAFIRLSGKDVLLASETKQFMNDISDNK